MIIEGRLVSSAGVEYGQVRFDGETIAEVGTDLGTPDYCFGSECLVFAGMGDLHVHAREDTTGRLTYKEDFGTLSQAAVHGGVVHVADMPNNPEPPIDDESYEAKQRLVKKRQPTVHVTLYAGIGPETKPLKRCVPYKVFMGPSVGPLFFRSESELTQTLARYSGCQVSFHCEDPQLLEQHKHAPTHEQRRPPECEIKAVQLALELIERFELDGKICHVSVAQALDLIRRAKREGVKVSCEVTPHHLFFDQTCLTAENRHLLQMNPPLRGPEDRQALLEGVRDGTVDFLATDHAPHTLDEKQKGTSGVPHLDTFGPFVTWLLSSQQVPAESVARICCEMPGQFASQFDEEGRCFGRIAPGYVASLTVLNLTRATPVRREGLRTKCGWSPFEGITFPGSVEAVFIDGRRVL